MKLYYVEHQVLTTTRSAIVAKDEAELKQILAEREQILKAIQFAPKFERAKDGSITGHNLGPDWTRAPHGPEWSGKTGSV